MASNLSYVHLRGSHFIQEGEREREEAFVAQTLVTRASIIRVHSFLAFESHCCLSYCKYSASSTPWQCTKPLESCLACIRGQRTKHFLYFTCTVHSVRVLRGLSLSLSPRLPLFIRFALGPKLPPPTFVPPSHPHTHTSLPFPTQSHSYPGGDCIRLMASPTLTDRHTQLVHSD